MNIKADIKNITYDNMGVIKEYIDKGEKFHIMAYEGEMYDDNEETIGCVGIWIESTKEIECTIMFDMNYEDAYFFAKSLIAMIDARKLNV